jgi:hypothetical protein
VVRITILLYGFSPFHFCSHVEAIITDEATNRSFNINFASFDILNDDDKIKYALQLAEEKKSNCKGTFTLHSNQSYDQFLLNFYHDFGNLNSYNFVTNNCADAVDYALDFFFPDKVKAEIFYSLYKTLCCWCCLGSCGIRYFPVPLGINSPNDVFRKAQLLADFSEPVAAVKADEALPCVCDSEKWNAKKLATPESCRNGFSLAIINKESNIVLHFIEKHLDQFNARQICYAYLCLLATQQNELANSLIQRRQEELSAAMPHDGEAEHKVEESDLVEQKYSFVSILLEHHYSRSELLLLLLVAVRGKVELEFIRRICEFDSGKFLFPVTGIEGKFTKDYYLLKAAHKNGREDVEQFFLDHYFETVTSSELGSLLLSAVGRKKYARAKSIVIKRPDVQKNWSFKGSDKNAHHELATHANPDLELFKLLCESCSVAELKLKLESGDTILSLARKNKNPQLVMYLVKHHAKVFAAEIPEALKYLENVKAKSESLLLGKIVRRRYPLFSINKQKKSQPPVAESRHKSLVKYSNGTS